MKARFAGWSWIFITLVAAAALCAAPEQASGAESLTFAFLDTDSKPYKWKENGRYIGYFIDVFDELSRRTGLIFILKPMPLKRIIYDVERGGIDGCLGYYRTSDREKFAHFLDVPLSTMTLKVYVNNGSEFELESIDNLYGKTVGILREQYVNDKFGLDVNSKLIHTQYSDSYDMMLKQLLYKRVDCVIGIDTVIEYNIEKHGLLGKFHSLPQTISINNTWILVAKHSDAANRMRAYERMNVAFREMFADGTLRSLSSKYGSKELVVFE